MKIKFVLVTLLLFSLLIETLTISGEPIINCISPEDGTKLDHNPILKINVSNDQPMDIIWYFYDSEQWKMIGTNNSVDSGIYQQQIPDGTKEGTNYQWRVNISDKSSYINETFSFRRIGWQRIFEGYFTFYAPDSIRNLSVFNIEGENVFYIKFDMKFYNYSDLIIMQIPGRLGNLTFNADDNGIYEVDIILQKDSPIIFPPGYQNIITISRPDGKKLDFNGYFYESNYNSWNINITGQENRLFFRIYHATDWSRVLIYVIFLLIPIVLNVVSWKKKRFEKFALDSTILVIPAIFFPLLTSDIPWQSIEMITIYIISGVASLISFIHWRVIQKSIKNE